MDKEYKGKLIEYYTQNLASIDMPDEMRPLLIEVLLRRVEEFDQNPQDIQQDLTSLVNNLKSVEIAKMPKGYKFAAGVYIPAEKKIKIAPAYLKNAIKTGDFETLYEIFTHETYHALCADQHGHDRLVSFNKYSRQFNYTLREAIVEKAADRCVFSRSSEEYSAPYFHQNRFGYADITFITDAIEATYGVSERAFLSHAIMGRDRMVGFLSGVTDQQPNKTSDFLDRIEMNYTRLHGALYGNSKLKGKALEDTLTDTLSSIYLICENQMQEIMEMHEVEDFKEARRYLGQLKFGHNKLLSSMEHAIRGFGYRVNADQLMARIEERIASTKESTISRISDFSQVYDNKDKLESKDEAIMLMRWSRYGNLGNYDQDKLSSAGITFEKPKLFDVPENDRESSIKMDFSRYWNNQDIIRNTYIFADSQMKTVSMRINNFFEQVSNKVKGLFNGQKRLNPPDNNTQVPPAKNAGVFGELSEEDLARFNQGMQSVLRLYNSEPEQSGSRQDESHNIEEKE